MADDYCRACKSWHRLSEFCNEDGRTEPVLIFDIGINTTTLNTRGY